MKLKTIIDKLKNWEQTSSRREKVLLFIVTFIGPAFLFFKFYYEPARNKIKILQEDIKKLELEIAKLEGFVKREKGVEAQIKQRKLFLEEVKQILPTEQEIPQLLKDVSMLAKRNGLEILTFTPRGEEKRNYYNIIPFDLHIKGSFTNTLKFLNEVERLARLVKLNSLEIITSEKDDKLTIKANFITYKYTGEVIEKRDNP
ncbi:MAG: type 4a pilus biogenesis protein PilO [Caldimicrobium sp.]|nr:type 4a pilus biogenesis protein PilO [Caldimicrobium sp.]MCX7872828.1 type 4a pilus biogenesis protein PilO [Caldimicrobium sp.]MDW8093593.1 type 4a pilus biogenesis protein PilO [Caldimicrobium sp.]